MNRTQGSPQPVGSPSPEEAGGQLAFLFDAHGRMVLGLCRFLLRDADEADDATQQTFLSAHRSLLGGAAPRSPAPWLAEIARNECRARIAARMREPLPLAATIESTDYDPVGKADQSEIIRELKNAIAELPDRQREAVVLRDFYGLSYREVAAAMTVSVPVVESLLFRARRHLGRRLGRLPRLAQGALAVPLALRDELARSVPGFDAVAAGLGISGGGTAAGVVAKLAAMPATAKLASATTVAAVAVGGAVTPQVADRESGRVDSSPTATIPRASSAHGAAGGLATIASRGPDRLRHSRGRPPARTGAQATASAGSASRDEASTERESSEAAEPEVESSTTTSEVEDEPEDASPTTQPRTGSDAQAGRSAPASTAEERESEAETPKGTSEEENSG